MSNERSGGLLTALPPVLQRVHELARICELEQPEFDRAWAGADQILQEQFLLLCGEYGLNRWEQLLGILPNQSASAGERVKSILFQLNAQAPFTYAKLKEMIALISPSGEYSMELLYDELRLEFKLSLFCKSIERLLTEVLRQTLPANIEWRLDWYYNTHEKAAAYTHGELAARTHYQIREEVLK